MHKRNAVGYTAIIILFFVGSFPAAIPAAEFKVLAVMSYERENPWCEEIREGIESSFGDTCETTYFYMDTKINLKGGEEKAGEAYALFRKLRPDGVIAADDNAQWMFVLPYLMNKADTPVMFCGVNAEAEKYGYPASNVSGILERGHIRESIAFAKQLYPSIQTVGFIAKDCPSGKALSRQVERESDTYPAKFAVFKLVKSLKELESAGGELEKRCDAIFAESMKGILDSEGNPLPINDILDVLGKVYRKPVIGANRYHVKQGALCAVVKTGGEQGKTAAEMLLKAMRGSPVSDIPITRNYKGRRIINVTVMDAFGIRPKPIVLFGAKLVRTEK